ncbi:hypothetical protein [Streptomyces shenzhenensis]|uniref:Uncharacterized protein n=1 Tax=Streptomyces shenzhenensis TaxID=943815 RepID=A0A3M0IHH7_9ACTN|nr:hypothetical protein [Streptomyces shenzhenensis]RMB87818.1 hypothetical protein CTZ28_02380 [Streptomyces shenzhenensis]
MFGDLVKAGTKAMGGARFGLLNVLPGALVVTVTTVLVRAHAYDLDHPVDLGAVLAGAGPAAVVAFALAALVGGILLRPFERVLVQQLEGYWDPPSPLARLRGAAVELHRRRRDNAAARLLLAEQKQLRYGPGATSLASLVALERRMDRQARGKERDERIRGGYPDDRHLVTPPRERRVTDLMPTRLGNALRRAERTAGGRYGLESLFVYPRIYPYLSERLAEAMARQLELLAATASLSVCFGLLCAITLPLLGRLDIWSLTPLAAAVLSVLAYRGAVVTAGYTGVVFGTVFDLHRFDLAAALHYELPKNPAEEYVLNRQLSSYLGDPDAHPLAQDPGLGDRPFRHPGAAPPAAGPPVPPAGDDGGSA